MPTLARFTFSTTGWRDTAGAQPLTFQFVVVSASGGSSDPSSSPALTVATTLSDASPAAGVSDLVLPMGLSGPGGVVHVGVLVRNALGCEALVDVAGLAHVTITPPSLTSLAAQFAGGPPGGAGSGTGSDAPSGTDGFTTAVRALRRHRAPSLIQA